MEVEERAVKRPRRALQLEVEDPFEGTIARFVNRCPLRMLPEQKAADEAEAYLVRSNVTLMSSSKYSSYGIAAFGSISLVVLLAG